MSGSSSYRTQVAAGEYRSNSYTKKDRWDSFWHQIDLVRARQPRQLLEIGPGPGIVTRQLRDLGIEVVTLDIADDVGADIIGSVTMLPVPDDSFDLVLAGEVLEHIRAEDLSVALKEIARVSRNGAVISVPTPGMSFFFGLKVPLLPRAALFFKIPFFWKIHEFDGQHYWELGTKGRSVGWFTAAAEAAGLKVASTRLFADAPYHRFFVLEKA